MQCLKCGHYTTSNTAGGGTAKGGDFVDALDVKAEDTPRIVTGEWWDEAWGGGFVPTECVLVTGAPGMGKSTLLIQIGFLIAKITKKTTYYISAEQEKGEWKMYLDRLGLPIERGMFRILKAMGSGGTIDEEAFKEFPPGLLILDSATALCGPKAFDAQIAVADNYKKNYSAKYKCPSLIISHINKEGDLAGAMTLQHNVDGICSLFPNDKERSRFAGQPMFCFHKHRFGPCNKDYQLIMTERGVFLAPTKEKMRTGGDALMKEIEAEGGEVKGRLALKGPPKVEASKGKVIPLRPPAPEVKPEPPTAEERAKAFKAAKAKSSSSKAFKPRGSDEPEATREESRVRGAKPQSRRRGEKALPSGTTRTSARELRALKAVRTAKKTAKKAPSKRAPSKRPSLES